MRIRIKYNQGFWVVFFGNYKPEVFSSHEAAIEATQKRWKRFYKENVAYSIVQKLSINKLSEHEKDFVLKLAQTQCKGITKKQYGWIRGLYERQEREW